MSIQILAKFIVEESSDSAGVAYVNPLSVTMIKSRRTGRVTPDEVRIHFVDGNSIVVMHSLEVVAEKLDAQLRKANTKINM